MLIASVAKNVFKFTTTFNTVLPFWGLKNVQIFDTIVLLPGTNPEEINMKSKIYIYSLQYLYRGNNLTIQQ